MQDFLDTYYSIQIKEKKVIDGKVGYLDDEYVYFTISATNKKAIHMEQATVAYFLVENGYEHTTFPIQNIQGEWITNFQGNDYLVVKAIMLQKQTVDPHGKILASFHKFNTSYEYQPQYISSYGQWKQLWIEKLTLLESKIIEEAEKNSNPYYRLLMDTLPYIIGISENAIQYIQESEQEHRYNEGDQGTITFQRYRDNLLKPMIWVDDLFFDHLTRDLSEFIRVKLLENNEEAFKAAYEFLDDYQSIYPLSVLSWRLLYARLIFPIHFFDLIEEGFLTIHSEDVFQQMQDLIIKQTIYEENIRKLFKVVEQKDQFLNIPLLQWL